MKKFIISLILVLCINLINAQNPLVKQWDYRFGGTNGEGLHSLKQTIDGGYILGGHSQSGISGDKTQNSWGKDYWLIKIDSLGSKEWDKNLGGIYYDYFSCMQQTLDSGFIIGGYTQSPIGGDKTQANWGGWDCWIIKTDSSGNKQWDKDFGGTNEDGVFSLQQTSDGGYILGGYSNSGISGNKTEDTYGGADYWIIKIDSLGNILWDKDFGGTGEDALVSIQQTTDGGYILGGSSNSSISGNKTQDTYGGTDYWIIKIDSQGNIQWDKDFGGVNEDLFGVLQQTKDNGYILGGISKSPISGNKTQNTWGDGDYWILKLDSLGYIQWDKDFGGTGIEDDFSTIFQTIDGDYIIGGSSYSPVSGDKEESNLGSEQSWIVKIDSLGYKKWDKTLLTTGHDELGLVIQTKDECFIMANQTDAGIGGEKTQPSWGGYDYWIIKFCDTTLTTSINQISNSQFLISIYPNPTNSILSLFLKNSVKIIITNSLGQIVLQEKGQGKVDLDVSFLSTGIYFVRVGNEVRKFAKE